MTVKFIHQKATTVCVCITNRYIITYNSEDCLLDGNISMFLQYQQIPRYV